jgi:hypothetical protein
MSFGHREKAENTEYLNTEATEDTETAATGGSRYARERIEWSRESSSV